MEKFEILQYDVIGSWAEKIDREINGQFYDKIEEYDDLEF